MPSSRAGINLHPGKGARARPWRAIRDHLKSNAGGMRLFAGGGAPEHPLEDGVQTAGKPPNRRARWKAAPCLKNFTKLVDRQNGLPL